MKPITTLILVLFSGICMLLAGYYAGKESCKNDYSRGYQKALNETRPEPVPFSQFVKNTPVYHYDGSGYVARVEYITETEARRQQTQRTTVLNYPGKKGVK